SMQSQSKPWCAIISALSVELRVSQPPMVWRPSRQARSTGFGRIGGPLVYSSRRFSAPAAERARGDSSLSTTGAGASILPGMSTATLESTPATQTPVRTTGRYTVVDSPLGSVFLGVSDAGVHRVDFI